MNKPSANQDQSMRQGRREDTHHQYGGGYGGSRGNSKDTKDVRNLKSEMMQGDDRVEIDVLEKKLTQLQIQRDNVK